MRFISLILLFFLSWAGHTQKPTIIGEITEGGIVVRDSVRLKKDLLSVLCNNVTSIDKIQALQGMSWDQTQTPFYYLLLIDRKGKNKVVRYLKREEKALYFSEESIFNEMYFICRGVLDCDPGMIILDNKNYWTCGETLICPITDDCISLKVIEAKN